MGHRHKGNVGKPCGSLNKYTGYIEFHVNKSLRYGHRMAWIYIHGSIPDGFHIDHINGIRSDNRLINLRLATHSNNLRNCKTRADNTSGVKGVSFDNERDKWVAYVGKKRLGRFDTLLDAAAARYSAANAAFGEFAREDR